MTQLKMFVSTVRNPNDLLTNITINVIKAILR